MNDVSLGASDIMFGVGFLWLFATTMFSRRVKSHVDIWKAETESASAKWAAEVSRSGGFCDATKLR